MSGPKISVVTVAYNAAGTIERTIESVLSQTYQNIEYLVQDGGSTDGTLDIVNRYGDRIALVSEPDKGIYDAMNKGVARATGEWIHILNADDWYTGPDALERAVPHLDPARTNYFDLIRSYEDGSQVLQSLNVKPWMLYVSAFLPHPGLIVSRAQYDRIGLFDDTLRIAADHDFILRMVKQLPPKHVAMPLAYMDQSGLSATDLSGSMNEFAQVTVSNGLPRIIAEIFRIIRMGWWRMRRPGSRLSANHSG